MGDNTDQEQLTFQIEFLKSENDKKQKIIQNLISENTKLQHFSNSYPRQNDILLKTRICQKLQSFDHFNLEKVISGGSNGFVVLCSYSVPYKEKLSLLIKAILNESPTIKDPLSNEYHILQMLPYHNNIIQQLSSFISRPSPQTIETISKELNLPGEVFSKMSEAVPALFMVLERLPLTLEHFITQKDFTVPVGLNLCKQIASALSFLWKNQLVHRDLKLSNILISIQSNAFIPIISEFGLAKVVDNHGCCVVSDTGNEFHTAPEAFLKVPGTNLIDYSKQPSWELGIICYEICSEGSCPFEPYEPQKPLPAINFAKMIKNNYPNEFEALVEALLHQSSTKRMQIEEAELHLSQILSIAQAN
eukprot:TRINITY_DN7860_c0_g1_i2.p1 TRINITY_DN7860_c0_g1~~TRINITY_DN7860_c0_g1_i2.p1  ORF type:complete len:362 (-),score=98.36 TRINITY_DN7860_c0_g1_i2:45-1130(-)